MDLINFFLNDNKSGYKTTERFLKKKYNELFNDVNNYTNHIPEISLKQRIWHYIYNVKDIPCCEYCEKELKFGRSLKEGYGVYCSLTCTNKSEVHIENVKKTNNIKYGGNAPIASKEIRDKTSKTNIDKYGVDNLFKDNQYIQNKIFEKHGVNSMNKLPEVKQKTLNTNIERYGVSTPLVLNRSRDKVHESKLNNFLNKYSEYNIINRNGYQLTIKCDTCLSEYSTIVATFVHRTTNSVDPCLVCNPVNTIRSIKEKQLSEFLSNLGVIVENNNTKILGGQEIDIYLPEFNIGVEFNGLYFHSDVFRESDYHINKTKKCIENGVKLIHIFEDEWDDNQDIVKNDLIRLLGLNEYKIDIDNCEIKPINKKLKNKFLSENSFTPLKSTSIDIGVYYDNKIIGITSFNKKNDNSFEVVYYCELKNYSINGGFETLLEYLIKTYTPSKINWVIDNRWGGDIEKFGFKLVDDLSPNYFYLYKHKRYTRSEIKKIDKDLLDILPKIYDCGNLLYSLNLVKDL
jgi:hypothetical protein